MCAHPERRDPALDACWRCLAAERDPPLREASRWWRLRVCRCEHPRPHRERCLLCGGTLPAPVTKYGQAA
jgi:hypothetical protein